MKFNLSSALALLIFSVFVGSCSHKNERIPASVIMSAPPTPVPNSDVKTVPIKPPPPETFTFDWPVDKARLTRGFLPNKRRPHLGIDLAAPRGTPILSSHKGVVIYAGRDFKGFGKMVLIESRHGWATIYAHLDRILVSEGQKVLQGEVIGSMGRTGRATGVHLHFEIRQKQGPVDPLLYLPQTPKFAKISDHK